ncbi:cytochrome p450 [Diplodia corticola]|uniref:Cytochrome p450 n=1 Tax=Diplodia corticola TaxID=236234 RepID=A0A1J9RN13_9PEZI|nr:cytochrome p450 [Diplodia corticola]OJD33955.1 cytochrome p450 [Diplodia corticola]
MVEVQRQRDTVRDANWPERATSIVVDDDDGEEMVYRRPWLYHCAASSLEDVSGGTCQSLPPLLAGRRDAAIMDPTAGVSTPTKGVLGLTLLAILGVLLQRLLRVDHDPREPPLIPTKVPLLGHVIGLYRHGKQYYQKMEDQYGYDIYTLALPGIKQYVITSPALTASVSRQSKLISFRPFIINFVRKSMLFDDTAHAINQKNLFDEDGQGVITASHDVFYNNLPSGPALDSICQVLLDDAAAIFNKLSSGEEGGGEINMGLVDFCKNVIGFPTLKALWGPDNIFAKDPTLLADFWDMEVGQVLLGIGILPSLVAPKAHRGRARLQAAMTEYYESGAWLRASTLIQQRAQAHFDHGYTKRMFAHSDTGLLIGALPNSTFTTFWLLARLFADPALLAAIRAELDASGTVTLRKNDDDGPKAVATIDVARLRTRCPLFSSTFRETLRLGMPTSSVRAVREDVMLADRHLLRKGSLVLIDAGVMHTKPAIWGDDAAEFVPRRFLDSQAGDFTDGGGGRNKVHPAAFRGFGGGEVFCPGRNLALVEATGIAAPLVCGWDIVGDELLKVPPPLDDVMPIGVWKPREDVAVRLRRREGWEGVKWEYRV